MSKEEQRVTAYHEAGHAVVSYLLPNSDPVRKITIMPRGISGGSTLFLPEEDLAYATRARLKDQIVVALGGRAAEEIAFDEITTGAASDLERVTRLARDMVTRFGMSDKLGPMMFGQKQEMVFLGREIGEQRDYSEAVAEQIDNEISSAIVTRAYEEARLLLRQNREKLDIVAQRLLEIETIDDREFIELMRQPLPLAERRTQSGIISLEDTQEFEQGAERKTSLGPNPSPA
jgi:cell division protease FtsH